MNYEADFDDVAIEHNTNLEPLGSLEGDRKLIQLIMSRRKERQVFGRRADEEENPTQFRELEHIEVR